MRSSRRNLLRWGLGAAGVAAVGYAGVKALEPRRGKDEPEAIEVVATPIPHLLPRDPGRTRFGDLTFRSGLVLRSSSAGFGGLSGLWLAPDGGSLVAVTDNAQWLTATLDRRDGRVSGLSGARLAPVLGQDGAPLRRGPAYDTEALAIESGVAYVGIERVHEVRRFAWDRDGVQARGLPLPTPPAMKDLPDNGSIEAIGIVPPGQRLAGALVAIAEEARKGDDAPTRGWVLTGPELFAFEVARAGDFDVTDLAFLETGEMLLLERRYSVRTGVDCRIRRVAADALRPGVTLDGPVIFDVDREHQIDNMEGLAWHRDPSGQLVLTMVSDDNFSDRQRTVMLEFALAG